MKTLLFKISAPLINEKFMHGQAKAVCEQIGECGDSANSDCAEMTGVTDPDPKAFLRIEKKCLCRVQKFADIFQTSSQLNQIKSYIKNSNVSNITINIHIFIMRF